MDYKKTISHLNKKWLIAIISAITAYSLYHIYIWSITQTTDNAYVEALISDVSAEISGPVENVLVNDNQTVEQGQIVASIDLEIYKAEHDKANAAVLNARNNSKIIEDKIEIAKIKLEKNQTGLEFAQENFNIAEEDFERTKNLTRNNYASQRNFDMININYLNAQNQLQQQMLDIKMVHNEIALLHKELDAANILLKSANADLILAKRRLDKTLIRSPINGILTNSNIREGSMVNAGRVLFSVVPDKMHIKANFKENQVRYFKAGMPVEIYVDVAKDYKITGHIRNLQPATGSKFSLIPPQNASGNFTKIVQRVPVLIDFEIPEDLRNIIKPGMSCYIKVKNP